MNIYLKHIIKLILELIVPVSKGFRGLLLVLIALILSAYVSNAQDIQIKSSLDTNMILIGEQTKLIVDIQYPKKLEIDFPILQDTIVKEIEILDLSIDTIFNSNNEHFVIKYTLTSFDSGYYAIPPQVIINTTTGDTILSNPLMFAVNTYQIDSASQNKFFDIKKPIDAPWTFKEFLDEYLNSILIGLLLIALIFSGIWYYKKRKKVEKPVAKVVIPKEAAHIVALRELSLLKDKKLWQSDRTKIYYVELSDIVRNYLDNRFKISSLEQTSQEILTSIENSNILNVRQQEQLKQILSTADMAKFAKAKPLANENDLALKNAFELVEQTKINESISTPKKETVNQTKEEVKHE